jgi:hypothetical protein|tara:strand:+ start:3222 stop:3458 length:237 start_codon:yes stop_codon:yes gene_type:complete
LFISAELRNRLDSVVQTIRQVLQYTKEQKAFTDKQNKELRYAQVELRKLIKYIQDIKSTTDKDERFKDYGNTKQTKLL